MKTFAPFVGSTEYFMDGDVSLPLDPAMRPWIRILEVGQITLREPFSNRLYTIHQYLSYASPL